MPESNENRGAKTWNSGFLMFVIGAVASAVTSTCVLGGWVSEWNVGWQHTIAAELWVAFCSTLIGCALMERGLRQDRGDLGF